MLQIELHLQVSETHWYGMTILRVHLQCSEALFLTMVEEPYIS